MELNILKTFKNAFFLYFEPLIWLRSLTVEVKKIITDNFDETKSIEVNKETKIEELKSEEVSITIKKEGDPIKNLWVLNPSIAIRNSEFIVSELSNDRKIVSIPIDEITFYHLSGEVHLHESGMKVLGYILQSSNSLEPVESVESVEIYDDKGKKTDSFIIPKLPSRKEKRTRRSDRRTRRSGRSSIITYRNRGRGSFKEKDRIKQTKDKE